MNAAFLMGACVSLALSAPGPVPSAAPAKPPLEILESRLDLAYQGLGSGNPSVPDMYSPAKSRLREVGGVLREDPKAKEAGALLQTCSLWVEAAVTQIQARLLETEQIKLRDLRISAISELNGIHDEINKLERGYASSLKSDLEEQKRKARERQEEADKRFNELNSALIQVSKDARGTIISMSDILFDVGKATLTTDLKTSLAKIAGILTVYKEANVLVEGHTDNVGGEDYNQKLSEKRAGNVMDFLVNPGGITTARLKAVGYAFSKPIADNATKEGRQKNRRVDLIILDKK
jgi:outer membrane protein OmpA-like peptidoglycan-associated protein